MHTSQQKLNFTKKATEKVLVENISSSTGYVEDPVLIGVYSATLNEDEIDVTENDDEDSTSRKAVFLKSMEDKLDLNNTEHKERYLQMKNRILEKVKATKTSRSRARSVSSITSTASKRGRSSDMVKEGEKTPVRLKHSNPGTKLPVKTN